MNIRHRTVSGVFLAGCLFILSALHFLWASGVPFPARTFPELELVVLPQPGFPAAGLTIAVAVALLGAAFTALLRVVDLNRGRHQQSRLLRIAVYAIAVVLGLRAAQGAVAGVAQLLLGVDLGIGADYRLADLVAFTPLCILLSAAGFALAGRSRLPNDLFRHTLAVFRRESFVHFTTIAPDGSPRSRVLYRLSVDDDGTVWLSTDPGSEKAGDIRADPRVVLSAYDTKAQAAATLEGDAAIITDADELAARWYPPLRLYFPRGKVDDRYALIRVTPRRYGIVDFSHGVTPAPFGLRRVTAPVPAAATVPSDN